MRRFALGTMLLLGLAAGCEKPVDGIPGPAGTPVSGGDDMAPPSVSVPPASTPAAPAADAKPADAPPAAAPAEPAPAADAPKQSSVDTFKGTKFVANTSLKVPGMSCPHGCWPTVEKTLAAQPGVEAVALAKQATEDSIDNPVVYIKLNGKFDSKAAVDALAQAGFDNAEVTN